MYNHFFELNSNPFSLTSDPSFLLLTPQYKESLAGLIFAIHARKGFVVLTSQAGMGKTTLLNRTLQQFSATQVQSSFILNPVVNMTEFLEMALLDFGFQEIPHSKAQRVRLLQEMLLKNHAQGKISVLVIDEAHKLSPEVLEEVRLLGNFERPDGKLLQIVMAGQNELMETLDRADLWQLKQRVAIHLSIKPLLSEEVKQYVAHRWKKAGGKDPNVFTAAALEKITGVSKGIPRVINAICDNALMLAFAAGRKLILEQDVTEACVDLRLIKTAPEQAPEPEPVAVLPVTAPRIASPAPAPPALAWAVPEGVPSVNLTALDRYQTNGRQTSFWSRWFKPLGRPGKVKNS
jgi:general secretion pathway protein A